MCHMCKSGVLPHKCRLPSPPPSVYPLKKCPIKSLGHREGPTRKPHHTKRFRTHSPTRKQFLQSAVHECLNAFFLDMSALKMHRHAVYQCSRRSPKASALRTRARVSTRACPILKCAFSPEVCPKNLLRLFIRNRLVKITFPN